MTEKAATGAGTARTRWNPLRLLLAARARRSNATCGCDAMGMTLRIGIDLGGTKIEAAAIDPNGSIRARRRIATPVGDYDATIAALVGLVAALESEAGACASVGVGIPGTIVAETGLV